VGKKIYRIGLYKNIRQAPLFNLNSKYGGMELMPEIKVSNNPKGIM
jgi:hypothetical protein